ncbi:MAG: ankyrin repeat domain-containing protein [Parashewanella sp.]
MSALLSIAEAATGLTLAGTVRICQQKEISANADNNPDTYQSKIGRYRYFVKQTADGLTVDRFDNSHTIGTPSRRNLMPFDIRAWVVKKHIQKYQALESAVRAGDARALGRLIGAGVHCHKLVDKNGVTLLMLAASYGHTGCLKLLLETKDIKIDDINAQDKEGWTALKHAVKESNIGCIKLLIASKASTEVIVKEGEKNWSPLTIAARYGDLESMRLLLAAGADINCTDGEQQQWTPLLTAIVWGHSQCAIFLLQCGANPNTESKDNRTPLTAAVILGDVNIVTLLIKKGAQIDRKDNEKPQSAIGLAIAQQDLPCLEKLLSANGNPNTLCHHGNTALCEIIKHHRASVNIIPFIELLLEHGASIITPEGNAISAAIQVGDTQAFNLLIKHTSLTLLDSPLDVPDKQDKTPLRYAVEKESLPAICSLVEHGASINALDEHNKTPLWYAVTLGKDSSTLCLLQEGATPYLDGLKQPLLDVAKKLNNKNSEKIVDILTRWQEDHPESVYSKYSNTLLPPSYRKRSDALYKDHPDSNKAMLAAKS